MTKYIIKQTGQYVENSETVYTYTVYKGILGGLIWVTVFHRVNKYPEFAINDCENFIHSQHGHIVHLSK